MTIIDGKKVAAKLLEECRGEIAELAREGVTPGLAVVIVGDDPASHVYVNSKVKTCGQLGIHSRKIELPADATHDEVVAVVKELNADDAIHGILVQSPPPPQIDEGEIINLIDPRKDVDGFHPINVGKLVMEDPTGFVPCTPAGCIRLLEDTGIETSGAEAVVIGRSLIVGKPLALLLMAKGVNATVTVAHSRTRELAEVCRRADILIAAIGQSRVREGRLREGGRGRDRCRGEPHRRPLEEEGLPAGGRRGLRRGGPEVPRNHARSGRGGPHDDRGPDEEHGEGGEAD